MHGTSQTAQLALLLFCTLRPGVHAGSPAAPPAADSAPAPAPSEDGEAVDAVAFFVLALLLGIFSTHLLAWTRVPYTALLLVRTPADVFLVLALLLAKRSCSQTKSASKAREYIVSNKCARLCLCVALLHNYWLFSAQVFTMFGFPAELYLVAALLHASLCSGHA